MSPLETWMSILTFISICGIAWALYVERLMTQDRASRALDSTQRSPTPPRTGCDRAPGPEYPRPVFRVLQGGRR